MKFSALVGQVAELLQRQQRISYRALKREFDLDDEDVEDLKAELIDAKRLASDEDSKVLVWIGIAPAARSEASTQQSETSNALPLSQDSALRTQHSTAERRQLTVMFCDLVGSTALSTQLDPEELREVVRQYQQTCAEVIERYDGYIAQYLGDGILTYFGYPTAHEDDAARAVRAGVELVAALQQPNVGARRRRAPTDLPITPPLHVRLGIHTGIVVVGEMGGGEKREQLALGETPNLAARIQGQAAPDEVIISAATYRLVEGLFECEDRGQPALKGVTIPLTLYRVVKEGEAQSRFQVVVRKGLTPLIGRDHEYGILQERWARVKEGAGQVVLLSGEPGIGKSRLVEALKEVVGHEGVRSFELPCSPYTQNSALAPVIEHLQRVLGFQRDESPEEKLRKLETAWKGRGEVTSPLQAETIALLASLLSLPHPDGHPVLTLSPQKQKEKTHEALVAWLCAEAAEQAVVYAWEDLHWADPSTLELLTLFLAQVPTTRLLAVLTFRPEFTPPWGAHSYLSQLTLSRLGRQQVREMVNHIAEQTLRASTGSARTGDISLVDSDSVRPELVEGRVALADDLIATVIARTDGVPLFVEELTKSVVEAGLDVRARRAVPLPLGVPATLQDALTARLDRLGPAKEIAQVGATIGREFNYELLQAVFPFDAEILQQGLKQLVTAELVYQSGVPPQARYLFKHALVQDTAYQSLLKSRRQEFHATIARVLEADFPQTAATEPELLAHHYRHSGNTEKTIAYLQLAGQHAVQRSANPEAVRHLTAAVDLLLTYPETPERGAQELALLLAVGPVLITIEGYASPEVGKAYARAQELCQQVGDIRQLFPMLWGSLAVCLLRAELQKARELAEQLLDLAESAQDAALLLEAHYVLGDVLFWLGEFALARVHLEQALDLYDPQRHRSQAALYAQEERGVTSLSYVSWTLWCLGYPDQALARTHEALALVDASVPPFSQAFALSFAAFLHQFRREVPATREQAEAAIILSTEQGFPYWLAFGTIFQGWVLAEQNQGAEGIAQMQQGLVAYRATGAELVQPYFLALLAEADGKIGQTEDGLVAIVEALHLVEKNNERWYEAEMYRIKGELLLAQARQQASGNGQQEKGTDP